MADLIFGCTGVSAERYSATPTLIFRLAITERSGARVHAIALRCQIRIEPHRRRYVRIGPWRVGNVVKRLSAFAFDPHQPRVQALDHLAQPGKPAPLLHVCDARGAERPEVAHHDLVDRQRFPARRTQPGRRGSQPDLSAALPERPWRNLHQRQQAACGLGKGSLRRFRPLFGQPGADLARSERLDVQKLPCRVDDRSHIDGRERPAMSGVGRQHAIQCRLDQRAQPMTVPGRDEMDGAAHQHDASGLAGGQQAGQLLAGEAVEPAPQPVIRRERRLRLHSDEVLDGVERAHRRTRQE